MIKTNLFGSNSLQTTPVKNVPAPSVTDMVLPTPITLEKSKENNDDDSLPLPPNSSQEIDTPSEAELVAMRERIDLLESKL